ncbi:hypothetical protein EDD16DRAFT_1648125 [Pisolithus croceorrhizus]|nr:hypothetical protein EDD16DRAFT_1648125 [Pisolithus croceorrhizus]
MPLVTNLIDDKSPLIKYDSTWLPGTSADDQSEDQYVKPTSLYLVRALWTSAGFFLFLFLQVLSRDVHHQQRNERTGNFYLQRYHNLVV